MLVAREFKNANLRINTPKNCFKSYRINRYISEVVAALLFVVSEGSRFDPGTVHLGGFDVTMIKIHRLCELILSTTEL